MWWTRAPSAVSSLACWMPKPITGASRTEAMMNAMLGSRRPVSQSIPTVSSATEAKINSTGRANRWGMTMTESRPPSTPPAARIEVIDFKTPGGSEAVQQGVAQKAAAGSQRDQPPSGPGVDRGGRKPLGHHIAGEADRQPDDGCLRHPVAPALGKREGEAEQISAERSHPGDRVRADFRGEMVGGAQHADASQRAETKPDGDEAGCQGFGGTIGGQSVVRVGGSAQDDIAGQRRAGRRQWPAGRASRTSAPGPAGWARSQTDRAGRPPGCRHWKWRRGSTALPVRVAAASHAGGATVLNNNTMAGRVLTARRQTTVHDAGRGVGLSGGQMKRQHRQERQHHGRADLDLGSLAHQPGGPGVAEQERQLEIKHGPQPGGGGAAINRQELLAHQRLDGKGEEGGQRHGGDDQVGEGPDHQRVEAIGGGHKQVGGCKSSAAGQRQQRAHRRGANGGIGFAGRPAIRAFLLGDGPAHAVAAGGFDDRHQREGGGAHVPERTIPDRAGVDLAFFRKVDGREQGRAGDGSPARRRDIGRPRRGKCARWRPSPTRRGFRFSPPPVSRPPSSRRGGPRRRSRPSPRSPCCRSSAGKGAEC